MKKEQVEKIKVTNNEFQKILEEEASAYWKKVFSIDSNASKPEIEKLKSLYQKEFDEKLSKYEVLPFKHKDKNVTKALNAYFNGDYDKGDYTIYEGRLSGDYTSYNKILTLLELTELIDTGYYRAAYNSDKQIIFEYCEGSISLETTNDKVVFDRLLKKTDNFIKENY